MAASLRTPSGGLRCVLHAFAFGPSNATPFAPRVLQLRVVFGSVAFSVMRRWRNQQFDHFQVQVLRFWQRSTKYIHGTRFANSTFEQKVLATQGRSINEHKARIHVTGYIRVQNQ